MFITMVDLLGNRDHRLGQMVIYVSLAAALFTALLTLCGRLAVQDAPMYSPAPPTP